MSKINMEQAKEMRKNGATFTEIGKKFGVSRQYVQEYMRKEHVRKSNVQIERIKYTGLRNYFLNNNKSFRSLARDCGISDKRFSSAVSTNFEQGMKLSIKQIKKMCEVTGKSFEELFKEV